ncbi:MAG: cytochrome c, partial [Gammaproteobacteria bacterium]
AQLEVVRDDALRLTGRGLSGLRRRGLEAKVRSALGVLPLTARSYLQDDGQAEAWALGVLDRAEQALGTRDWKKAAASLSALCRAYPLRLSGLRPGDVGPAAVTAAGRSYQKRCAMCHRYAQPDSELPAPDLFRWSRSLGPRSFVARMIDGVHGTAFTSFENPLTDTEIAALYAYFRAGRSASPSHSTDKAR